MFCVIYCGIQYNSDPPNTDFSWMCHVCSSGAQTDKQTDIGGGGWRGGRRRRGGFGWCIPVINTNWQRTPALQQKVATSIRWPPHIPTDSPRGKDASPGDWHTWARISPPDVRVLMPQPAIICRLHIKAHITAWSRAQTGFRVSVIPLRNEYQNPRFWLDDVTVGQTT